MDSRNWIGGEWYIPKGSAAPISNPSNIKEYVGIIHFSEAVDVRQASVAAQSALPNWSSLTYPKRAEYLSLAADALLSQLDELATLASKEVGKPINEMRGEIRRGIDILRYYAAEGMRTTGSVIPSTQASVLQYTSRVPLGIVGIITPWNFPVAIPIWKMAPALLCGNTIIWKPSELSSLTATRLAEIFSEAKLPLGVLNLVVGEGKTVGQALLDEAPLDGVSFTGSAATGRHVAISCAKRNIKYQTEMGGKNAAVVLNDADLSNTIPAIIGGAFRFAGQKCTATSRVIVHRDMYEQLLLGLASSVSKLVVGPAQNASSYLGPVVSAAQKNKVNTFVEHAHRQATIVQEGKITVDPESGHYVAPIVVSDVDVNDKLVQDEIFGPVISLLPADSFDEAVDLCNKTVYGLSASIFTNDLNKALKFMNQAKAGMVRVNLETSGVEYQSPFGGMKSSSSHSREQGTAALDFYSQIKTCAMFYGL